jgi:ATP-binding cassette, subfamily B, bacterial PglK
MVLDENSKNLSLSGIIHKIWKNLIAKRKYQLGGVLILTGLVSFLELVSLGALLPFLAMLTQPEKVFELSYLNFLITFAGINSPSELLFPMTAFLVLSALIAGFSRIALLFVQTKIAYAIGADFGCSIYRRCLFQPYAVHITRNSAELISNISLKARYLVSKAIIPIMNIISGTILTLIIISGLFYVSVLNTIIAIVGFGFIYAATALLSKSRIEKDSIIMNVSQNTVIKALQEGFGGIRDIILDGTQELYVNIFKKSDVELRNAQANALIISGTPRYAIESIGIVLIASLAYFSAQSSDGIAGTIPYIGTLAMAAQRLLPNLQLIYAGVTELRAGKDTFREVVYLLEQRLPNSINQSTSDNIPFKNKLSVNKVMFKYFDDGPEILSDISLEVNKGERIGVIGKTGSGKTTLMDILLGLLVPDKGHILIDGKLLHENNRRNWQSQIAHVPQSIFLTDNSIKENIAFGVLPEDIDLHKVQQVAKMACISDAIEKMPNKYSTKVGERGTQLSGGQRQRIGLARALYKEASVIVFDEATSALDNKTETLVTKAIDNLHTDLTLFIVAHRLTSLKNCDYIIELDNGKITRNISFENLIRSN